MDPQQKTFDVPWPAVITVAALLAGYFTYKSLQTSRPADRSGYPFPKTDLQDVNARLWQDPLRAAYEHAADASTQGCKNPSLHVIDALRSSQACSEPSQILAVMIPGGSYAEYNEIRLRTRHAVAEACGKEGYMPRNGEYIGYTEVDLGDATMEIVPFEWWDPNGAYDKPPVDKKNLLLLWVREDALQNDFLTILNRLLGALTFDIKPPPVTIIGPRSSTTLLRMLHKANELAEKQKNDPPNDRVIQLPYLNGARIFCPTATASTKELLEELNVPNAAQQNQWMERCLSKIGVTFERFTTTDDQLCCELGRELQRRGVDLDQQHIALISEFDTFYGRALPRTFIDEAQLLTGCTSACKDWQIYQYLRGIDGQVPQQPIEQVRKKQREQKTTAPNEPTEGLNQADYLTRLADQLGKKRGVIKAVGVLGTDVYDKLMILRALRKTLPGVIFFTTNLDARYGHPDEWQAARNLIVSSPFGFSLRKELQPIPPFRDSYQTATYAATLAALGNSNVIPDKLGEPRMFEIARDGPFDLSDDLPGDKRTSIQPPNENLTGWFPIRNVCFVFLIGLSIIGAAYWAAEKIGPTKQEHGREENSDPSSWEQLRWSSYAILAAVFFFCWFIVYLLAFVHRREGEPFAWFQGISIWPTETFRLFVAFVALFFFGKTLRDLALSDKDLGQSFGLVTIDPSAPETPNFRERLFETLDFWKTFFREKEVRKDVFRDKVAVRAWKVHVEDKDKDTTDPSVHQTSKFWKIFFQILYFWKIFFRETKSQDKVAGRDGKGHVDHKRMPPIDAEKLWRRYVEAGRFRFRALRFLPLALAYAVAGFSFIVMTGIPPTPYRGFFSYVCDGLVLLLSVGLCILLTFYIADATLLNRRLIHYLVKSPTKWPSTAYEKLRERKRWSSGQEQPPSDKQPREYPPGELLDDYLDIDLIARRTSVVGDLIYYPFILISILIVSRNALFDNWTWPYQLLIVIGGTAAYALWSAVRLRAIAENARKLALESLNDRLIYIVAEGKGDSPEAETAREMMTMIKAEHRGAFAPFSQHPVFRALLLPSGGAGIWALTQYLPFR